MPHKLERIDSEVQAGVASIEEAERAAARAMLDRIEQLRQKVILALVQGGDLTPANIDKLRGEWRQIVQGMTQSLTDAMTENQRRLFVRGIGLVDRALKGAGIRGAVPYLDETKLKQVQRFGAELVTGLTEDIERRLTAELRLAVLGGKPISEVVKAIGANLNSPSIFGTVANRAEVIMRTEANRINALSTIGRMKQFEGQVPDLKKEWVHSHQGFPRRGHLLLDGQVKPVNANFRIVGRNGKIYRAPAPHDPSLPAEEVVNCRCKVVPVVSRFFTKRTATATTAPKPPKPPRATVKPPKPPSAIAKAAQKFKPTTKPPEMQPVELPTVKIDAKKLYNDTVASFGGDVIARNAFTAKIDKVVEIRAMSAPSKRPSQDWEAIGEYVREARKDVMPLEQAYQFEKMLAVPADKRGTVAFKGENLNAQQQEAVDRAGKWLGMVFGRGTVVDNAEIGVVSTKAWRSSFCPQNQYVPIGFKKHEDFEQWATNELGSMYVTDAEKDALRLKLKKYNERRALENKIELSEMIPTVRTTIHEFGHWLEDNVPEVRALAQKLMAKIKKRAHDNAEAAGGRHELSMAKIFGGNYKPEEIVLPDESFSLYSRKVYKQHNVEYENTELTSMALEAMYDSPAVMAKLDEDLFEYVQDVINTVRKLKKGTPK